MRTLLSFLGSLFSLTFAAEAQWVRMPGPGATEAFALAAKDTILFAGTNAGVFRSSNFGENWQAVNSGISNPNARSFLVKDTVLFVGTDRGIFTSMNLSDSWAPAPGTTTLAALCFASKGNSILAGTRSGIYRSSDNGTTWNSSSSGLGTVTVNALTVHAGKIFAATSGGGVFVSDNDGLSWTSSNFTLTSRYIYCFAALRDTLFIGGDSSRVYKSTNSGASWVELPFGYHAGARVSSLVVYDTILVAGTSAFGVFVSESSGYFVNVDATIDNSSHSQVNSLLLVRDTIFVAASSYTPISKSPAPRSGWVGANNGLIAGSISAISTINNLLLTSTRYEYYPYWEARQNIFYSQNDGITWSSGATNDISVWLFATRDSLLFAAGDGIFMSIDKGRSWIQRLSRVGNAMFHSIASIGSYLFAGTTGIGVYRSIDNGLTWTRSDSGLGNRILLNFGSLGPKIFAGTDSGLYVSTDAGISWGNPRAPDVTCNSLAVLDSILLVGTSRGVIMTTENGSGTYSLGLNEKPVNDLRVIQSRIFAAVFGSVYRSDITDAFWVSFSDGLPHNEVLDLASTSSYVFANVGRLYRRPLNQLLTTITNENSMTPKVASLEQNHLNPFNPTTMIPYKLSQCSRVRLRIYDLLGREIATLVEEVQDEGSKSVKFDASRLAAGVYFYKLNTGSFVETKRMLLVK